MIVTNKRDAELVQRYFEKAWAGTGITLEWTRIRHRHYEFDVNATCEGDHDYGVNCLNWFIEGLRAAVGEGG